jgi:hypothetical protein
MTKVADRGIRVNTFNKFMEMLPLRATIGNTEFRRGVMQYAMAEFEISLAAASTHYNDAFKKVKASNPELVLDLGRAEDKKGGRKPKAKVDASVSDNSAVQNEDGVHHITSEDLEIQELFNVYNKKTGDLVEAMLTFDEARERVASNRNSKGQMCKMYFK